MSFEMSNSDYAATEKIWNESSKAKRMRLLLQANIQNSIHSHRAFKFIPSHVQEAVIVNYQTSIVAVHHNTKHQSPSSHSIHLIK
jgi:hypothetical protein